MALIKGDAAAAAATPPDQGSAMELELSQALIELRRLTLFQGPALGEAIPRYFTEEQLRGAHGSARGTPSYTCGDLREAAATRALSRKGRAWLGRGTSPRRMLEQRVLRATSWKDFTEEEVAAIVYECSLRHSLTSRLAAKARAERRGATPLRGRPR